MRIRVSERKLAKVLTHQVDFIMQSQVQRICSTNEILQHPLPETHLIVRTISPEGGVCGMTDTSLALPRRARSLDQLLYRVGGDLEDFTFVDDMTGKVVQFAE